MTRLVVMADTHVQPGGARQIPPDVYPLLEAADLVLHAGDVTSLDLLHQLEAFAPIEAVLGNHDRELLGILSEVREVDVDGYRIAMIHDSGATAGRAARMRRRFPDADMVVFGHSHEPLDEEGVDGQRLFNPGSSTWKRMAQTHTIGLIDIVDGRLTRSEIVDVGIPAPR